VILRAFFARSPDASTVSFRYYLLGGDTAALSGLFARLCHKFLVTFFLTDFSGTILTFFFTRWKHYGCRWSIWVSSHRLLAVKSPCAAAPRISVRCRPNIYISRLCYDVSVRLSVRLSVTEVHWRIIANLGFKFRSKFTMHCFDFGAI